MVIDANLNEEETEFHPGFTQYSVYIDVPNKGIEVIILKREVVHGTYSSENKTHPILLKIAIDCAKEYLAKIYTQSYY